MKRTATTSDRLHDELFTQAFWPCSSSWQIIPRSRHDWTIQPAFNDSRRGHTLLLGCRTASKTSYDEPCRMKYCSFFLFYFRQNHRFSQKTGFTAPNPQVQHHPYAGRTLPEPAFIRERRLGTSGALTAQAAIPSCAAIARARSL